MLGWRYRDIPIVYTFPPEAALIGTPHGKSIGTSNGTREMGQMGQLFLNNPRPDTKDGRPPANLWSPSVSCLRINNYCQWSVARGNVTGISKYLDKYLLQTDGNIIDI